MPGGAIYVGRPSPWGNPFPVDGPWIEAACVAYGIEYILTPTWRQAIAVALYRWWMTGVPVMAMKRLAREPIQLTEGTKGGAAWLQGHGVVYLPLRPSVEPLRGHDLACWCPEECGEPVGRYEVAYSDVYDPCAKPKGHGGAHDPWVPLWCHADVLLELANR
jgi:hypothetical protein